MREIFNGPQALYFEKISLHTFACTTAFRIAFAIATMHLPSITLDASVQLPEEDTCLPIAPNQRAAIARILSKIDCFCAYKRVEVIEIIINSVLYLGNPVSRSTSIRDEKILRSLMQMIHSLDTGADTALRSGIVNTHHHAQKPPKSHLLALPPELRTKIFEFSLTEANCIDVTDQGLKPPGLLAVSTQVRDEAITIYYSTNRFRLVLLDYNPDPLMPFCLRYKKYFVPAKGYDHHNPDVGVLSARVEGQPNWQNLERWCRLVYSGQMGWHLISMDNPTPESVAIVAVFLVLANMARAKAPGTAAAGAMEGLGMLLDIIDSRWAQ
ncbi:hypothetical protein LTR97_012144 [Elasticomyces elasticus]|uniref:Uncharacterized protein n=1 Tax=Elasticomyces elasticus TaxID=574655 RepID=A0AAN7W2F3_9PEZI|nr:hypothetical protein LTR97_012144 [Elasticomyces elasticus]